MWMRSSLVDQPLRWVVANVLGTVVAATALAGTFGSVVPIGGHAADVALDEKRGVLYVANFTGNRIEVISTASRTLQSSINVAAQPASIALSPDGRFLAVAHYGAFQSPSSPANTLTILDLNANTRQTFAMGHAPLAVAFGIDNMAFLVTTQDFVLVDPVSGATQVLDSVAGVTAKNLPVPAGTFPPEIVRASIAASGDGWWICGVAETGGENKTVEFRYNVNNRQVIAEYWTSSPPLGPRVTSVNQDGSLVMNGWGLLSRGVLLAQFRNASGKFNFGSHAIDSSRGLVYMQMAEAEQAAAPTPECSVVGGSQICVTPPVTTPKTQTGPPVLLVADLDNFTVRERLLMPENLAGRSVMSSDSAMMYAICDSGVMFLPVGSLAKMPRVAAGQEDVVVRGSFCDRTVKVEEVDIVDPGGGRTDFTLATTMPGVRISPASGTTPARVKIAIDPNAFQNQKGTVVGAITIKSSAAVNLAPALRVLVNNREPDQRGTFLNVPGRLVDVAADPARNRFYVLRQDKNQVLVFDASTYRQIATLRTGNTPTQMAVTFDRQYLIVGNDDSQIANVYDLESLQATAPIVFPAGHYPRSIAVSGGAILAAVRVAGPVHVIDRVDIWTRTAAPLPSLGIYENKIDVNTVLSASPSGGKILAAQADGTVMLYDATSDTFIASRKDVEKQGGAYAALSEDRFAVDNRLLNESLSPVRTLDTGTGASSGFAVAGEAGLRTTAAAASAPGVIERMQMSSDSLLRATRMAEAPVMHDVAGTVTGAVFTRTLAPLASRAAIVSLTTSGVTVLPWNYDAAVAEPRIEAVRSAADGSEAVASGGLVKISGRDLSVVNAASREVPLPTALADSCLTVNGVLVPMVMASSTEINAQLPYGVTGTATMVLRTPAGVSNNFRLTIQPAAPSVFRSGTAGAEQGIATVVRSVNRELVTLANPIHPEDWIVIYATGLGATMPAVDDGYPGPANPLAEAAMQPEVTLGGVPLAIGYAGLAPGEVGVYQINAKVPFKGVPEGIDIPLQISQGGFSTTLAVRVVH